jgi:hypothetical protein
MKVKLTLNQIQVLKSMNNYWEEISKRPDGAAIVMEEIRNLNSAISFMDILLIVGDYAKSYKAYENPGLAEGEK